MTHLSAVPKVHPRHRLDNLACDAVLLHGLTEALGIVAGEPGKASMNATVSLAYVIEKAAKDLSGALEQINGEDWD